MAFFTKRPEPVAGAHFFDPVPGMKLVEVVRATPASGQTIERVKGLARFMAKTPMSQVSHARLGEELGSVGSVRPGKGQRFL